MVAEFSTTAGLRLDIPDLLAEDMTQKKLRKRKTGTLNKTRKKRREKKKKTGPEITRNYHGLTESRASRSKVDARTTRNRKDEKRTKRKRGENNWQKNQ